MRSLDNKRHSHLKPQQQLRRLLTCGVTLAALGMSSSASAAFVMVYGGPTWDQSTQSGYRNAYTAPGPGGVIAGNGVAVAAVLKDGPNGVSRGTRAVRWDASGSPAIELGNLGTSIDGFANGGAGAVNTHGTVVGQVEKYNAAGTSLGYRAVRWNATGTVATELGNLGTDSSGYAVTGGAGAINDAGTAAGGASRYSAAGTFLGHRAVRWDASGTAATELDHLGTNASGFTESGAGAINAAGTIVGSAKKYGEDGWSLGVRAVRWDAGATAATELGHLGTNVFGITNTCYPSAVNAAGDAVGVASKYTANGTDLGMRAVLWAGSGTAATELETVGANSESYAYAINDAGVIVGQSGDFPEGATRAVRWNASTGAATELGDLGTDDSGNTVSMAYDVNAAGAAVGQARKYIDGFAVADCAVLWKFDDGLAIDLNALIDPASDWFLFDARAISDTNWVSGIGSFDPDGAGPLYPYARLFLLDASSVVPEPAGLPLLLAAGLAFQRRARPLLANKRREAIDGNRT